MCILNPNQAPRLPGGPHWDARTRSLRPTGGHRRPGYLSCGGRIQANAGSVTHPARLDPLEERTICPNGAVTCKPRATPWEPYDTNRASPERAKDLPPFVGLSILFRPFRALVIVAFLFLRALPWAVVFAPLQGEKHAAAAGARILSRIKSAGIRSRVFHVTRARRDSRTSDGLCSLNRLIYLG